MKNDLFMLFAPVAFNVVFNVVFNDLQGLDISDDVKMLGKRIGRITGTRIIGQKIAVELTIDNTFALNLCLALGPFIYSSFTMDGKGKQGSGRIAQGVDLGIEVLGQFLKGLLDTPALTIQLGDLFGRSGAFGQVA